MTDGESGFGKDPKFKSKNSVARFLGRGGSRWPFWLGLFGLFGFKPRPLDLSEKAQKNSGRLMFLDLNPIRPTKAAFR
jgi:hypothetical protein